MNKKSLLILVVLGCFLTAGSWLFAQAEKAVVGDWEGAVFVGGDEVRLICHFVLSDEGVLDGTIDSPDQGGFDIPLADIEVDGKKISFGIDHPQIEGDPRFSGELDEAGTTMSGKFSQGGNEGTFEFNKSTLIRVRPANDEVLAIGNYLAGRIEASTGFAIPVGTQDGKPSQGNITIKAGGDGSVLGDESSNEFCFVLR